MENKKTFGAYILQRRKELGMTQKEFAEKLYVTESAVSKWERGMSYPDITLLRSICQVLDISEHELLTGSEDTQKRQAESLAEKYLHLTKNYRVTQYIIYGLALLGCAVGNLVAQHTLSWFFIVLASVMMAASLTLVPSLTALRPGLSRYKGALAVGCFTFSLELLLLICCIYTGGSWFPVAGVAVLFGMTLVLLPILLPTLPLPACMVRMKASVYLATETILLVLLLLVCFLYYREGLYTFVLTTVSVLFGLGFFILPVFLRQFTVSSSLKRHKALLYFGIQTLLLILLLFVADLPSGGSTFLPFSIPVALLCLALPWGIMLAIRYLPVNGWFKAAVSTAWASLWLWLGPCILDFAASVFFGNSASYTHYPLWIPFTFTVWNNPQQIGWNVVAIILFSLTAIAALLAVTGIVWQKKKRHE